MKLLRPLNLSVPLRSHIVSWSGIFHLLFFLPLIFQFSLYLISLYCSSRHSYCLPPTFEPVLIKWNWDQVSHALPFKKFFFVLHNHLKWRETEKPPTGLQPVCMQQAVLSRPKLRAVRSAQFSYVAGRSPVRETMPHFPRSTSPKSQEPEPEIEPRFDVSHRCAQQHHGFWAKFLLPLFIFFSFL